MDKLVDPWSGLRRKLAGAYQINIDSIQSDAQVIASRAPGKMMPELISGTSIAKTIGANGIIPPLEETSAAYTTQGNIRHIEHQFDELVKLVEACRLFRREYAEYAKLYLETRLGLEEFFRIDAIHQLEVAAGAYEVPWKEAEGQLRSTSERLAYERLNEANLLELFSAGQPLDQASVEAFVARNGEAARQSSDREPARAPTADVARYRMDLERRQWGRTLEDTQTEVKSLSIVEEAIRFKAAYLSKDVNFRQARAAIARDLSYTKRAHHIAPGGPLNYAERIAATRELFNRYLICAVDRALSVADGARQIYGLPVERPKLEDFEVLDSLSSWVQSTQELLSRRRRRERIATIGISIADRFDKFRSRLEDGVSMELIAPDVLNLGNARLRGVAVDLITNDTSALTSISVTPPGEIKALPFGRVMASRDGPIPQFAESVWNNPVLGTWAIRARAKLGLGITDVLLTLWVAYVPE